MKKITGSTKTISTSGRWAQNGLFQPGGQGADCCSGPWKGCCAGYWKRGEAWCQGDLWKCRRRLLTVHPLCLVSRPRWGATLRHCAARASPPSPGSSSRLLPAPSSPLEGLLLSIWALALRQTCFRLWRSAWSYSLVLLSAGTSRYFGAQTSTWTRLVTDNKMQIILKLSELFIACS